MPPRMVFAPPPSSRERLPSPPLGLTTSPLPSPPSQEAETITIKVRTFDGACHEVTAPVNVSVADLKKRIQALTSVHAASQRLVFAGSSLEDSELLSSSWAGVSMFLLENKVFPARLGPFATNAVPWSAKDFELPPLGADFEEAGCMWLMEQRALVRHGIRGARGIEFPLAGQFSPPHPVTLTAAEKAALSIPAEAAFFVWSYPVAAWSQLEGGSEAARTFLSVGGFIYLDASRKIIHATTLLPASDAESGGGLQFGRPAAWRPEWTQSLMRQGRFQRITIKPLNDVGAKHYCWVRPGEVLNAADGSPCAEQPRAAHGAFAYLFHDDVFACDITDALELDRYFPIVSGDDYEPAVAAIYPIPCAGPGSARAASERRTAQATFALVAGLTDLQEELATHEPATGGGAPAPVSSETQTRIHQLERQLDSLTKCVCCLTEEKDTILGCGHVCMCRGCASRVQRCPVCRARISERRRAFQG